jgi:hypothetical protein
MKESTAYRVSVASSCVDASRQIPLLPLVTKYFDSTRSAASRPNLNSYRTVLLGELLLSNRTKHQSMIDFLCWFGAKAKDLMFENREIPLAF